MNERGFSLLPLVFFGAPQWQHTSALCCVTQETSDFAQRFEKETSLSSHAVHLSSRSHNGQTYPRSCGLLWHHLLSAANLVCGFMFSDTYSECLNSDLSRTDYQVLSPKQSTHLWLISRLADWSFQQVNLTLCYEVVGYQIWVKFFTLCFHHLLCCFMIILTV